MRNPQVIKMMENPLHFPQYFRNRINFRIKQRLIRVIVDENVFFSTQFFLCTRGGENIPRGGLDKGDVETRTVLPSIVGVS